MTEIRLADPQQVGVERSSELYILWPDSEIERQLDSAFERACHSTTVPPLRWEWAKGHPRFSLLRRCRVRANADVRRSEYPRGSRRRVGRRESERQRGELGQLRSRRLQVRGARTRLQQWRRSLAGHCQLGALSRRDLAWSTILWLGFSRHRSPVARRRRSDLAASGGWLS